ncbi:MAG: arylamine N-acetyltransferase family protein [Qingshengfaniella sp.]
MDASLRVAYLARLGMDRAPEATLAGLTALVVRHLAAVPFENYDIFRRVPVVLDTERAVEKVALHRRGGFCFEVNEAFRALLVSLGFVVKRIEGRVWIARVGRFGAPFDHLALVVSLPEGAFLVDVGFGDNNRVPMRLPEDTVQDISGTYHLGPDPGAPGFWVLTRRASPAGAAPVQPLYRMTLAPRALGDFSEMCRYHQTAPESLFMRGLVCTLPTQDGRLTMTADRLIQMKDGVRSERRLRTEEARLATLRDTFGVV